MSYSKCLVAMFAASLAVPRHSPAGPRIVSNTTYKVENCKEDPLTPCYGERIVIENLWMVPAQVILSCGMDLDEQEMLIPARTRLTVDIEMSIPVPHPACVVKKANRAR